jgi:hypothetical protein
MTKKRYILTPVGGTIVAATMSIAGVPTPSVTALRPT